MSFVRLILGQAAYFCVSCTPRVDIASLVCPSVSRSSRQKNRTAVCEEEQAPAGDGSIRPVVHSLAFRLTLSLDVVILRLRSDVLADAAGSPLLFA